MRWFALVLVLGVASSASAQEVSPETLVERGISLREAGDDAGALALFEEAHRRQPVPRTTAQLGLAHLALGHFVEADAQLERALDADDPWITSHREALVTAWETAREHVGTLIVTTNTPEATWTLDGRAMGPVAGEVRVLAGERRVEVSAEGFAARQAVVEVHARGSLRVDLALVAAPHVLPGSSEVTAEPWFWVATIGGAALIAGGVVLGVVLAGSQDGWQAPPGDTGGVIMTLVQR